MNNFEELLVRVNIVKYFNHVRVVCVCLPILNLYWVLRESEKGLQYDVIVIRSATATKNYSRA